MGARAALPGVSMMLVATCVWLLVVRMAFPVRAGPQFPGLPFASLPSGESVAGPIPHGVVPYTRAVFGSQVDDLVRGGFLCVGAKGMGKTNLNRVLALYFPGTVLVLDTEGEFADLIRYTPRAVVLPWQHFANPPFTPPMSGIDPRAYLLDTANILSNVEGLLTGSKATLERVVIEVAERAKRHELAFDEVLRAFEEIKSRSGPEGQYVERVRARLRLVRLESPAAVTARESIIPRVSGWIVVVAGAPPSGETKRFIVASAMHALLSCQAERMRRGEKVLPTVVIVPESHVVFGRELEQQPESGRPAFAQYFLSGRRWNMLIAGDTQNFSLFSRIIGTNTQTIIAFNSPGEQDVGELASAMNLTAEQTRLLRELPPYWALAKTARWPAFPIKAVHLPQAPVSPEMVLARMEAFFRAVSWSPTPEFASTPNEIVGGAPGMGNVVQASNSPPPLPPVPERIVMEKSDEAPAETGDETRGHVSGGGGPTGDALEVLRAACASPFSFASELQRNLGWGGGRFQRAFRALELFSDHVRIVEIRTGTPGKPPVWIQPRPLAFELLGLDVPSWTGGIDANAGRHTFWKERVARQFAGGGRRTSVERSWNGKRVDVVVEHADGEVPLAVEVELSGAVHAVGNIKADLAAGFRRILSLFPDRRTADEARERVRSLGGTGDARVESDVLGRYLRPERQGGKRA